MDLQDFINRLDQLGELRRVDGADWDLEIGTITELGDERGGPALLFDHIKGYPSGFQVVSNLIATPGRMAAGFGFPPGLSNIELVRRIKDRFKDLQPIPPVYVREGPVLQNVYRDGDVDMFRFPTPRWHEADGGRYIGTGDMVVTKDPKDGWVNVGTYRVQIHDKDTLGLYISPGHQGRLIRESYWAQGKACPVAVVFGAHPMAWMPAFMPLAWGVEEYRIAGGLMGEPLKLVAGEYTGLPFPADSEIVVEGDCPPPEVESRKEGPFGEWTGYYASGARSEAVIKVKRVLHRNNPVILGCPPLRPPASGSGNYVLRASNVWYEMERLGIPGIRGVWDMRAGASRLITVVSIEQKYAGHAKQAAMAALVGPDGAYASRFVIVVDEDIDPTSDEDVLWAMATRCDPATSLEIVRGCWSTPLDPTISPEKRQQGDFTSSRAMILACRPFHWRKDFPKVNRASDELRAATLRKWATVIPAQAGIHKTG
ncbi:MAG: UbiD family decarboxylase [Chloroflexi bacterium]|nr:UbiD family decarboxylase [Chloroflexota bacterium]